MGCQDTTLVGTEAGPRAGPRHEAGPSGLRGVGQPVSGSLVPWLTRPNPEEALQWDEVQIHCLSESL
jgi:hypothetical protein